MLPVRETSDRVSFQVRVIPRSSKTEIIGIQDSALKIKIMAPPVEGKANNEVIRLLADKLGVRKNQVAITAGHKSKSKTVAVSGVTKTDIEALL